MRPLALALLVLVLVGGALASCSTPQPATLVVATPSPTPTASPTVTPFPTPTPTAVPTAIPTPTSTPSPTPTPNTMIPIMEGDWQKLDFPGDRVDSIFVDTNEGTLYAIQLPWRGVKGQIWISRDQGNSWTYWGREITPNETQYATVRDRWEFWTEKFGVTIFHQLEVNPKFLPPVIGRADGGLESMIQNGSILFATIYDRSSNDELARIPARQSRRIVVSLDNGNSWVEIISPRLLRIDYAPSLAIGREYLYLANEGDLWRHSTPTSSPS